MENQRILSATLSLHQTFASTCTPGEVDVYDATEAFTGATTWNTQPAAGTLYASASAAYGATACPSPGWVDISTGGADGNTLEDLVQSWANGYPNYGMVVKAASETSTSGWKKFDSSETNDGPTLSVTFEPAEVNELLAAPWLDEETVDDIVATDPDVVNVQTASDCPGINETDYPIPADHQNIPYRDLHDATGNLIGSIYLDVSSPPSPGDLERQYPAMILVHGGGWSRGCKHNVQKEASVASGSNTDGDYGLPQQFLAFNINYRLSCTASNPNLVFSPEVNDEVNTKAELCGYSFSSIDNDPGLDGDPNGPAIHDVEAAIDFVQQHANEYCPPVVGHPGYECWNGKIELVGNSAGGNLAYMASGRLGPNSAYQVDAIGAWSGPMKFFQLRNANWPCDSLESAKPDVCKKSTVKYVNCPDDDTYPPGSSTCQQTFKDAGPNQNFTNVGLPRTFFANGDPTATFVPNTNKPEIISLNSALDFKARLDGSLWSHTGNGTTGVYKICQVYATVDGQEVPVNEHARTYIYDYHCQEETSTSVYVNMVSWLQVAVS